MNPHLGSPEDEHARRHLAAIVESSDDAILSKDLNGIITSWNAGAERLYGYTAEEAIGRSVSIIVPEGRENEIPTIMDRLRRGERIDHHETVRQAKDGRSLNVSLTVSPICDSNGEIIGASAIARDLTASQQAERALARLRAEAEQRQRLYETIISSTPDLVYAFDLNYRFTYANAALLAMWGRSWDDAIGKSLLEIGYEPWHAEMHEREIDLIVATKQVVRGEVPFPHHQLGERIYDYILAPVVDSTGEVEAIIGTTRDVTQRKQTEQRLHELNATLEQRVAERTAEAEQRADQLQKLAGELTEVEQRERRRLAQLLHDDLQQLLVAAKMRLKSTASHGAVDEARALLAQAIDTSRSLTTDLAPPVLYDFGLNAALEWLVRWARDRYQLNVEFFPDGSDPGESDQLRALLFDAVRELLLNIVKHADVDAARITLQRSEGRLRISVEDDGVGFDPTARRPNDDRSGYGLFSLQERLQLLGGHVHVDSAPDEGTRVQITVPLPTAGPTPAAEPCEEPQGEPQHPAEPAATPCTRVLLTDDHEVVRQGLAHLLEQHSGVAIVAQAASGEEAIDLAHEHRPDVVVMDISLPGISGVDATRRITAAFPQTCVIGLSMHEENDVAEAMRAAGARAYLNKNEAAEKLVQAIHRYAPVTQRNGEAPA